MAAFPLCQDISEFLYIRPLCKRGELFYHIIFIDIYIFQSNISLQRYFIDIIEALYKCIYHLIHNAHHIQTIPKNAYEYMYAYPCKFSRAEKGRMHLGINYAKTYRHSFSLLQIECLRSIQSPTGQWTQAPLFSNQLYLGIQS